jgi:L-histidine Nalpha-methyltransferase
MLADSMSVVVHSSLFPEVSQRASSLAFGRGELLPQAHYASRRQMEAWVALHIRYSPFFTAADGGAVYDAAFARAAASLPPEPPVVISLGCGAGHKDVRLFGLLAGRGADYIPVDAGLWMVLSACARVSSCVGNGHCHPQLMDLGAEPDWGRVLDRVEHPDRPRLVLYLGMMPTLDPGTTGPRLSALLRKHDRLVLSANLAPGTDYLAGTEAMLALYDNPETRAWLSFALADLGLDPAAGKWDCRVGRDLSVEGLLRAEIWFTPEHAVTARFGTTEVLLGAGSPLRVFCSNRFNLELVQRFFDLNHLTCEHRELTQDGQEGVFLLRKRPGHGPA